MEIKYNITGKARKDFVKAVGDILAIKPEYMGAPSFGYSIGSGYTVTRDGNIITADNARTNNIVWLMSELEKRGYKSERTDISELDTDSEKTAYKGKPEPQTETAAKRSHVFMIPAGHTENSSILIPIAALGNMAAVQETVQKLKELVKSKQELFQKALGTINGLEINIGEDIVEFKWFDCNATSEQVTIYSNFINALYSFAAGAVRINTTHKPVGNEKFAMRTFLNRIGLSGSEHKALRKELLKNLTGSSAFRYGRPAAKEGGLPEWS